MQLFHETLRKGVNQLLGDPNCEAIEWLRDSYCQKATLGTSCAQGEDSKCGELVYL